MTAVKDDADNIVGYERRYHNDNGDITRLDRYDADQSYQSYVLYTYDDDGRLYTETTYAANGIGQSSIVYTYDDDGRLSQKAYEYPHSATVELYGSDGNVIEKQYYDNNNRLSYREVMEDGAWVRYEPTEPPTEETE